MDSVRQGELSHILNVAGEEEDDGVGLVHKMKERMKEIPLLLPAVGENRCIFKLPQSFESRIDKSYKAPQIVSIGPYHHHKIDHHNDIKWQCLEYLLHKNEPNLQRYIESIRPLENKIKECYSEEINLGTDDLLEMMVLDGCFLLEWLCFTCSGGRQSRHMEVSEDHPLALIDRVILLKIYHDLLLLENQIPFFVPETLFEVSNINSKGIDQSLSSIGAEVFSAILGIQLSEEHRSRFREVKCLHLLDIVRTIFVPPNIFMYYANDLQLFLQEFRNRTFDTIPRISKLRRAGIIVSPRKKDSLLMVEFRDGVIEMPKIILNDLMCSFLMNCVAFEQCRTSYPDLSVYALFLSCLVKNAEDVDYLCEHRVMDNYIETDATSFIENLGKGIATDPGSFINKLDKDERFLEVDGRLCFFSLCFRVNQYYQNRFHWQWTNFKAEYFDKPWMWISVFAALVLFVLSFLQTYYTMYPRR